MYKSKKILQENDNRQVNFRKQCFPFFFSSKVFDDTELKTLSSSCVCQPSCALSGWTAPVLSAGPAGGEPQTASPPAASLWTPPFKHEKTQICRRKMTNQICFICLHCSQRIGGGNMSVSSIFYTYFNL